MGFSEYKNNFARTLPTIYNYRTPEIVKGSNGWYIEYYFRIPLELKEIYGGQKWQRFRRREDMNRRRGQEREAYAEMLRAQIEENLRNGFNPFEEIQKAYIAKQKSLQEPSAINATDAMNLFISTWKERGLDKSSIQKYTKVINRFIDWLASHKIPFIDLTEITTRRIETFLNDMKRAYDFGNREYNNHYDFLRTAFNFLLKKKYIPVSPMAGIDKQKSKSTKHRYYDDKNLAAITKVMQLRDPWTLLAFQTVYYLCVRSEKELKNLKVGNIDWERSIILAQETKGGNERYIPFDNHLKELFLKAGFDKYPADYYLFTAEQKPGLVRFGTGYFSKRFMKVRKAAGLSSDYSIYGAKHTRIIHLKTAGVSDADIMSLTGHTDFEAYTKYLRDLGMTADISNINAKSRKI